MAAPIFVSALILTFGAYTTTGMLVCPGGWQRHNNKCYWFSAFNATNQSAQSECEIRNSSLVITDNLDINTFLQKHILNDRDISYWIGLGIPNLQGNSWQWPSGLNLDTRFVDWCDGAGIKDNFLSNCAVANYFTNTTFCLRTYGCTTSRRFVCEKEIDRHALCPSHFYNNSYGERRSCYFVSGDKETHTEAAKVCWSKGMRLVTVPDDAARRFMESINPGTGVYWVGLSPYKWIDKSAYNWNNWNQVPSITLKCTTIQFDGTWHSSDCSQCHNFICQKGAVVEDMVISTSIRPITMTTHVTEKETTMTTKTSMTQTSMTITTSEHDSTTLKSSMETTINSIDGISYPVMENTTSISTVFADDERQVLLYLLIGIYSAVGVTTIVFIGLLAKYISLRRRHKMDPEKPIEVELDDGNFDGDDDFKLYDNPDYVGVEHQEQCTSGETAKPPAIVDDNLIYSETSESGQVLNITTHKDVSRNGVPSSRINDIALEDISLTTNHEVINGDVYALVERSRSQHMSTAKLAPKEKQTSENVALKQISDSISKDGNEQTMPDHESSDYEDDGNVYYNNPHSLNTNSNFEDDNIYDDAIIVTIPESVNLDTEDDKL